MFYGDAFSPMHNSSRDAGKSWYTESDQILFSKIFFLSDEHINHSKTRYDILDLLSNFGGLYTTFIWTTFLYIGTFVDNVIMQGKLIRSLFYQSKKDLYKMIDKQ
jgi:hypothetical protein